MKTKFVLFMLLNLFVLNSFGQKKPTKGEIDEAVSNYNKFISQ